MRRQLGVLTALCALLIASAGNSAPPASAAGDLGRGYDWTVRVETEELQGYFKSTPGLRPLDRANIDYFPGEDDKSAAAYQKLWYHDGQPLGLERLHDLGVTKGENICVRITHKKGAGTPGEMKAAANAILRVWLDAQLNKSPLVVVKVPGPSLQPIANELVTRQHLSVASPYVGEQAQDATMLLLLESEQDGQQINLAYK